MAQMCHGSRLRILVEGSPLALTLAWPLPFARPAIARQADPPLARPATRYTAARQARRSPPHLAEQSRSHGGTLLGPQVLEHRCTVVERAIAAVGSHRDQWLGSHVFRDADILDGEISGITGHDGRHRVAVTDDSAEHRLEVYLMPW
jgi:hypothetical protein